MTTAPLIPRKYWGIALVLVAIMAAILLWMGRSPICECGTVRLFVGAVHGPDNSQHIADWYTPSHIIHGFLFYLLGIARRLPVWATVATALAFELITLLIIRDNLFLNVLMLVAPNDAVRAWQGGL